MIELEKARGLVLERMRVLPSEKVTLANAVGRFLRRDLKARLDLPRCDQSAMDGYAVRSSDVKGATVDRPATLHLAGALPAGSPRRPRLRPGHAWRVFTGSALPTGTEAVVMQEYTRREPDVVLIEREAPSGEHIRWRGEEFRRGDPVLSAGHRLDPPAVGLLANFGYTQVPVGGRPLVSVLTIGDELALPGRRLARSQIYNSNGPALCAVLARLGLVRVRHQCLPDDAARLRRTMRRELERSDVVITAGGASVGDHDHVRAVAAEVGIEEVFRRVAVKPGKPNFFGTWRPPGGRRADLRYHFGLPGNPVSVLVSYHSLVKPALLRMMGAPAIDTGRLLTARLASPLRKRTGRRELVRAVLAWSTEHGGEVTEAVVHPLGKQGSHMMGGLADADCLIHFPRTVDSLAAGTRVRVELLNWDS